MTQEREMQTGFAAGGENDKRRRPHARLRDVLDVQARAAVSPGGDDAATLYHALVKLIQLRSRNASAARFVGADRERQELPHSLANQSGDRYDRRPAKELHLLAHLALERRAAARVLILKQVPFIQRDDYRAAGFGGITRNRCVQRRNSLLSVEQNDRDVGALKTLARHRDGKFFSHRESLAFAPNAGGVDDAKSLPWSFQQRIDRVASCAGNRRNDRALFAEQTVQ